DANTSTVKIAISFKNIGASALVGPIRATILKLASPKVLVTNADIGSGVGTWSWVYNVGTLSPGAHTIRREWTFISNAEDFQADMQVTGGVPVPAGFGGTITAQDGCSITIQPNSIPYEALIDINLIPPT